MSDIYTMSDEEFAQVDLSTLEDTEEPSEPSNDSQEMPEETDEAYESETEGSDSPGTEDEYEESDSKETEEDYASNSEEQETSTPYADNDYEVTQDDEEDEVSDTSQENIDSSDNDPVQPKSSKGNKPVSDDLKTFHERLTAPFKANGKQVQITNPDDMIALMQQGVNYSQKMAKLKPQMGIVKTLEENGITSPGDVSYLVDIFKQEPAAIAKLIKDSEIDLYDFDTEQAEGYKPLTQVSQPTDLDEVVEEYQGNVMFSEVLTTISNGWDLESKRFVSKNPNVLRVLTAQKESGLYDKIMSAIEYEQMLGRLNNVPLIEAYSMVESRFNQEGNGTQSQESNQKANSFRAPRPSHTQRPDNNASRKRKAGSPQSSGSSTKSNINPLKISDEELLKLV